MPTSPRFAPSTLLALRRVREVRIQTTSADAAETHRTTIWVVVVGDQAFVRSERGTAGRWYREARAQPEVILHIEGAAHPVTAVLTDDPDTIHEVSDAFRKKYGKRSPGSTEAMVQPHTLETTLRLAPRQT